MVRPLTAKVISTVTWPDAVRRVHDMAHEHDGTEFLPGHLALLESAVALVKAKINSKE